MLFTLIFLNHIKRLRIQCFSADPHRMHALTIESAFKIKRPAQKGTLCRMSNETDCMGTLRTDPRETPYRTHVICLTYAINLMTELVSLVDFVHLFVESPHKSPECHYPLRCSLEEIRHSHHLTDPKFCSALITHILRYQGRLVCFYLALNRCSSSLSKSCSYDLKGLK